jgi:hypothetical protein
MTNEEIIKRIDVGFKSKDLENIPCPFLRLECLKLAFDVAHKTETFDPRKWANKSLEEQLEAYDQICELAEMNYKFLVKERE